MISLDTDLSLFEEIVSEIEPLKCEARHEAWDNQECSEIATHVYRSQCGECYLVCALGANWAFALLREKGAFHSCGNNISEDWEITPL